LFDTILLTLRPDSRSPRDSTSSTAVFSGPSSLHSQSLLQPQSPPPPLLKVTFHLHSSGIGSTPLVLRNPHSPLHGLDSCCLSFVPPPLSGLSELFLSVRRSPSAVYCQEKVIPQIQWGLQRFSCELFFQKLRVLNVLSCITPFPARFPDWSPYSPYDSFIGHYFDTPDPLFPPL